MTSEFETYGFVLTNSTVFTFLPVFLTLIFAPILSIRNKVIASAMSCLIALYFNILDFTGLMAIVVLSSIAYLFKITQLKHIKWICGTSIFLLSTALLLHLIPGFNNPLILNEYYVSDSAVPYTKYLNYDKAFVAIILLTFVVPRTNKVSYENKLISIFALSITTLTGLGIGMASGLVELDPKLSPILLGWALTNLFITCYAEEAFFRGFIQTHIANLTYKLKYSNYITVLGSGLLFGLAHFPAGPTYTLIATLVGTGYAFSYYKSNNIYVPIFAHFGFNLIHFIFFTYPYIK